MLAHRATRRTYRVRDPLARIRIPQNRIEPIFSSLWRLDLCERTWIELALSRAPT